MPDRRAFLAALLAAPVAAVAAVKMKRTEMWDGKSHTRTGRFSSEHNLQNLPREMTREQQKRIRYAYNYAMSAEQFKELFNA